MRPMHSPFMRDIWDKVWWGDSGLFVPPFNVFGAALKITVLASKVESDMTHQVLLDLSDIPALHPFWIKVKADGGDMRFTMANGTTPVAFEIISIDKILKTGEVRFLGNITDLTNKDFILYYDNPAANLLPANDTYGSHNVWTNRRAVYHLQTLGLLDSTVNASHLTNSGAILTDGQIYQGIDFLNANNKAYINDSMGMNGIGQFHISFWMRGRNANTNFYIFSIMHTGGSFGINVNVGPGSNALRFHLTTDVGFVSMDAVVQDYSLDIWRKVDILYTGSEMKLYSNGVESPQSPVAHTGNVLAGNNTFTLCNNDPTTSTGWGNDIDEVHISHVAHENTILTEYNNESDPSSFYIIGNEITP